MTGEVSIIDKDSGLPIQRTMTKILENMMSEAAKLAKAKGDLDMVKINRANKFLELAEGKGFGPEDILDNLTMAIREAKKKGDSRALTRLCELQYKMFLEVSTNIGEQIIKISNTQVNIDKALNQKGAGAPPMSEETMKQQVADLLQSFLNEPE